MNIKLEFGLSRSLQYERALEIAQALSNYSFTGEGRQIKHIIELDPSEISKFQELYGIVNSWKSTVVWIKNVKYNPRSIGLLLWCIARHESEYNNKDYCSSLNPWGCQQITSDLQTGKYTKDGLYHFNKDEFFFNIKDRLKILEACPFFEKGLVLDRINSLPDIINPEVDEHWEYATDFSGGLIGVKYIQPKEVEFELPSDFVKKKDSSMTKVIPISNEKWIKNAEAGYIPELEDYLNDSYLLKNIIFQNNVWYCILEYSDYASL